MPSVWIAVRLYPLDRFTESPRPHEPTAALIATCNAGTLCEVPPDVPLIEIGTPGVVGVSTCEVSVSVLLAAVVFGAS